MYDMVFISYNEPNADIHYNKLKIRFPLTKRVHGIKGIHNAHVIAAKKSLTHMFWVIDGDADVLETFDFDFRTKNHDTVYVWRSINPINDLEYGNGGVKLLPRLMTINMDMTKPDMTTSISEKFVPVNKISNITAFNSDSFNTWKSAFRECCKLSSKTIDRQKNEETEYRLNRWSNFGSNRSFGQYAIDGAKAGTKYGLTYGKNREAMRKINDFDWLKEQFEAYYE